MKLPKTSVIFTDCMRYIAAVLAAGLAGTVGFYAVQILLTVLLRGDRSYTRSAKSYILLFFMVLVSFAVTLVVRAFLFVRYYSDLFDTDVPRSGVYINALALIFPAEAALFFLSSLPWKPGIMFGGRFFGGIFTPIPSVLYNQLYIIRHGGLERIREDGYLPADHRAYILIYLAYFLLLCAAVVLIFHILHRKAEAAKRKREEKYAEDATKDAREYVRLRDYFYSSSVTRKDRLRFAAISFGAQFAAYLIAGPAVTVILTIYMGDSATGLLMQVLLGIPLAAILPYLFFDRFVRRPIREWFSLADAEKNIPEKLFSLTAPAEIVRFGTGLIIGYGAYTSPLPSMLFTLIHRLLTGGFEPNAVQTAPTFVHLILFFLIYLLCFLIHERIMQKRLMGRVKAHLAYLAGTQAEKDKYQNYYHR